MISDPRKTVVCALVLFLVACAPTGSETLESTSAPDTAPTLTDDALQALRDQVLEDVDAGHVAGAVALVATPDEELMFESFGVRSLESGEPMENDTIFRIFSMTKPITSTAVMMLHEQGHFELDDPVGVYLPELADLQVGVETTDEAGEPTLRMEPAARAVTIRDLLRHTSGMTYGLFAQSMVDTMYLEGGLFTAANLEAMVAEAGELPLKHQPGRVFEYSISTDMLGRLVEGVSGQSFDEFLQEHIFDPLAMSDTAFWVPEDKIDRLAGYYLQTEDGLQPMQRDEFAAPPTLLSGGGGLVSTASDYLRFCRMILGGGELDGVRILQPESVAEMGTDQLAGLPGLDGGPPGGSMVTGFGLGFALTPDAGPGQVSAGTRYWYGYASTAFWIDPAEELIGIYLIQVQPFNPGYGNAFQSSVYELMSSANARASAAAPPTTGS